MERPVTDVAFVCSLDNVPAGFQAVQNCVCGHSAQLWEKVIGGEAATRYFCFSKETQKDDMVLEDMYIPSHNQQYLRKGYHIITDTVEKEEPLRHKQLAVKRVHKAHATTVIVDIIICRSKDSISKLYTKLMKVNGCQIAFRTAKYTPGSPADPVANVSNAMDKLDVSQDNHKTTTSNNDKIQTDGAVQVKAADSLGTAPPLPPSQPSNQSPSPTSSPSGGSTQPPPITNQSATTSNAPYPPPPTQPTPPPPQATPTSMPTSNYPPPSTYASSGPSNASSALPYQMNPVTPAQITPFGAGSGGYMGGAAYDTNIGFSFGGKGAPGSSYNPSLPAPYNPYQHQQASPGYPPAQGYPPAAQGYPPSQGYPPTTGYPPYPPTQGNSSWGQPQGGQNQGGGIGFNF